MGAPSVIQKTLFLFWVSASTSDSWGSLKSLVSSAKGAWRGVYAFNLSIWTNFTPLQAWQASLILNKLSKSLDRDFLITVCIPIMFVQFLSPSQEYRTRQRYLKQLPLWVFFLWLHCITHLKNLDGHLGDVCPVQWTPLEMDVKSIFSALLVENYRPWCGVIPTKLKWKWTL